MIASFNTAKDCVLQCLEKGKEDDVDTELSQFKDSVYQLEQVVFENTQLQQQEGIFQEIQYQGNGIFSLKAKRRQKCFRFESCQLKRFLFLFPLLGYFHFSPTSKPTASIRVTNQKITAWRGNRSKKVKLLDSLDATRQASADERTQSTIYQEGLKASSIKHRIKQGLKYSKYISEFIRLAHYFDIEIQGGDGLSGFNDLILEPKL